MNKRRIIRPYRDAATWPTQRDDNAFESEFSERYIDVSAPDVVPPRGSVSSIPGRVPPEQAPGSVVDKVPVGGKTSTPVVRQARFVNLAATAGLVSVQLLASNQRRSYLLIVNNSGSTIFVTFDRPASLATGVPILGGGNYEPITPPVSSVFVISLVGNLPVIVVEGVT